MSSVRPRWWSLVALAALFVVAFTPRFGVHSAAAAPVACSTFLQSFLDHARQPVTSARPYVEAVVVANNAANVASYAEHARLFYVAPTILSPAGLSSAVGPFAQPATQYFNDRRDSTGPFDPARTDQLGLSINGQTGQVQLKLVSWEGALITIKPVCENGLMYGFNEHAGTKTLYVISLAKRFFLVQG
jgi:hypothetical protein